MKAIIGIAVGAAVTLAIVGVAMRVKMARNLVLGSELVATLKLPA